MNAKAAVFITAFILLMGYANVPMALAAGDELDAAIQELSDYLNNRIPAGNKVVFLNVKSDYPDFSEYILSSLIENAVNGDVFTVVDRQQLDVIRAELNFQWSGEVSDASAQEIGQMLGAQVIVSGSVTEVGPRYRIQVRAISVQTASVLGLSSKNLDSNGPLVTALTTDPAAVAAATAKREEEARRRKEEAARKRENAKEKFLESSGIGFGGWLGSNSFITASYGVDIELIFSRYFGLHTGLAIFFEDANEYVSKTLLQIPVLAKVNIPISFFYLSAYGGIGINLSPFESYDTVLSHSPLSIIAGGEAGMNISFLKIFVGLQYNRDLSDTSYSYEGKDFSYLGERVIVNSGIRLYFPFRRKE